jgi:hypothetical protein
VISVACRSQRLSAAATSGGALMGSGEHDAVAVSRRIAAPAAEIFAILADPKRHMAMDGSGMLRGAVSDVAVTGVGDVFVMSMYYSEHGDYEMNNHVVEYQRDRRIGWEPVAGRGHPDDATAEARWGHRWIFDLAPDGPDATVVTEIYDCSRTPADESASIDEGRIWIDAMTQTLKRLDDLCTGRRDTTQTATPPG